MHSDPYHRKSGEEMSFVPEGVQMRWGRSAETNLHCDRGGLAIFCGAEKYSFGHFEGFERKAGEKHLKKDEPCFSRDG